MLSNLIGNAISYGKPGGPVRVTIRGSGAGEVLLDVHNEGPPIPDEIRPALFDAYRRGVQKSSSSRGLGLGLYIANAIAVAHGGGISVESTEEAGTTFAVRLPRRPSAT